MGAGTNPAVESFATLFRTEALFVWRVLRRYGVPERELEDACQEVFVVVHRRQERFEGRSSLRTWLYGIARRVASHHARAMRARPPLAEREPPEPAGEASNEPEQELDRRRMLAWLQGALATLDEDTGELALHTADGAWDERAPVSYSLTAGPAGTPFSMRLRGTAAVSLSTLQGTFRFPAELPAEPSGDVSLIVEYQNGGWVLQRIARAVPTTGAGESCGCSDLAPAWEGERLLFVRR